MRKATVRGVWSGPDTMSTVMHTAHTPPPAPGSRNVAEPAQVVPVVVGQQLGAGHMKCDSARNLAQCCLSYMNCQRANSDRVNRLTMAGAGLCSSKPAGVSKEGSKVQMAHAGGSVQISAAERV